jgi:hypothetical protein
MQDCNCSKEEGVLSVEEIQQISFFQNNKFRTQREKINDLLQVCKINVSQNSDLILDQLFNLFDKTFYPQTLDIIDLRFKIYYGFSNYWKPNGDVYGYDFRDLYLLFSFPNEDFLYAKSQTLLNSNLDTCKLNKMSFYEWRNFCSTANIFFPKNLGRVDRLANRL